MLEKIINKTNADRLRSRIASVIAPPAAAPLDRRAFFQGRQANRYWWHRTTGNTYVPDIYAMLTDDEFRLLCQWFDETDARNLVGECSIPLVSWLASFITSNGVKRVVQLGTYAGYSTLLLGWTLRRMGMRHSLVAVDIDQMTVEFTRGYLRKAGLEDYVTVHLGDSAAADLPAKTTEYFGAPAQLVFIDSSHQYAHTLRELDLWYGAIPAGGLIAMHDTSKYAGSFDSTGQGGAGRALMEWRERSGVDAFNLSFSDEILANLRHVYLDGCGLGLMVKDSAPARVPG